MMRVFELAKQLGWTSSQLVKVLVERGEYVKSAVSKVEAPVVRAMLREFASEIPSPMEEPEDTVVDPRMYGRSAAISLDDSAEMSFGAELARIKAQPSPAMVSKKKSYSWMTPILKMLLDEIIVPARPDHLGAPEGPYYAWEIKEAKALHQQWVREQLNGLSGDDRTVIAWIRLSGDGQRPAVATELSLAGISPDEAALRLSYGRLDPRRATVFQRFRDGRISRTEALAEINQWRRSRHVG